jgi:hypothetical protein
MSFPHIWNRLLAIFIAGGMSMLILLGACAPGTSEYEPSTSSLEPVVPTDSANEPSSTPIATEAAVDTPEATQPTTNEDEPVDEPVSEEIPQSILDAVLGDTQMRSGSSREEITIQQAEYMNWNDGSLGCPRPNREYVQEVTPGYRIELQAEDTSYVYHTNTERTIILCFQDGLSLIPIDPKDKIQDGEPWVPVD